MLVTIDNHPKLRAPVAEVVVADRLVAEEFQGAVQAIADDGAADVAHVHRLGDVGGAVVDDVRLRLADGRHAERGSADAVAACAASQSSRRRKLMKPGPAISGGSQRSAIFNRPMISAAISRGGFPSRLPNGIAQLA